MKVTDKVKDPKWAHEGHKELDELLEKNESTEALYKWSDEYESSTESTAKELYTLMTIGKVHSILIDELSKTDSTEVARFIARMSRRINNI